MMHVVRNGCRCFTNRCACWFQGAGLGSLSDMDDLATTFAKVSIIFIYKHYDDNLNILPTTMSWLHVIN